MKLTYEQKKQAVKKAVINGASLNMAVLAYFSVSEIDDAMRCLHELQNYFCNAFC